MKTLIFCLSFGLLASLAAADCNGLSSSLCSSLQRTGASLSKAIEDANAALANAMAEAAQRRTALCLASFNILRSHMPPSSAKTMDDVDGLSKRLDAAQRQAEADQQAAVNDAARAFEQASQAVTLALANAILEARSHDSAAANAVAFAVGGTKMDAIKKKLEEALKRAHGKVKEVITQAIVKVNEGLAKLEGFLKTVLGEAGIKKVQELLTIQVERLLKAIADSIAKQIEGQTAPSFDRAVKEAESFIDELEKEARVSKRSAFWDKVKAAVAKLGSGVREAAIKALEKHKDNIMQKLKELGKAILDAGQDVVIEVVNNAVRAVVQS